jgi:hypothetical protein
MIAAAAWVLDRYARRRRRAIEFAWRDPAVIQERALLDLVRRAAWTDFGLTHGFPRVRCVADYQARVPLRSYVEFAVLWDRAARGEADVTWPGRPAWWVKTAGTTAGEKFIPVTREALAAHRRGGWDSLLFAAERVGARRLLSGPMLLLGGSSTLAPYGQGGLVGDLSGLVVRSLPPVIRGRYSPGPAIAAIADWETRIAAIADLARRQDLRLLAGMPSWMLILLDRVAELGDGSDPGRIWPDLRVFVHGGVSFAPYRSLIEDRLGRRLEYLEVYPASEGFVGLQTETTGGLTLMLDYGLFYEFVPVEALGSERPERHTVADLQLGRPYAVALTTPAGLWSYVLGDTVRFTARDPLRLEITGRVRHFVNAFGENVIVEEVEQAILEACRRTEAELVEFTVAPRYPSPTEPRGGHDWLVEFARAPRHSDHFAAALDEVLAGRNADYRTKRTGDVGMRAPRVVALPPGSFYRWMRAAGKLGDQHKVPRVTNDRAVADGLMAAGGHALAPAPAASS